MDQPYCVYCSLHTLDSQHEFTKDIDELVQKITFKQQLPCKDSLISNLNDESRRLNNERESYQDQIKQINEQWGGEFIKLQDTYHQVKQNLDLCQGQNRELEKSVKEKTSEVESLQKTVQSKSKEVDDMMNIIKGHSQFQLSLREQNHKLSQELINSQTEIQTLNDYVNNMQKGSQNTSQSQYQQLQKDHKDLQEQFQKTKILNEQIKQDFEIKFTKLNSEHENKLNQIQDQLDGIYEKVKVVTIQNNLLINENHNSPNNDNTADNLILKLDKLVNTLIHQNQIISSSNTESKSLINTLNSQITDYQTNLLNLNNQNEQYRDTETLLQNQVAALKSMVQSQSQDIDLQSKKVSEQQLQISQYESKIEGLKQQSIMVNETHKAQVVDLSEKQSQLQAQIQLKNMQIQQQIEQVHQLQSQMHEYEKHKNQSQNNSNELSLVIQSQQHQIESFSKQNQELQQQLVSIQQELNQSIEFNRKHQELVKSREQEILSYEEQIEPLSNLVRNQNEEIDKLKQEANSQKSLLDSQMKQNSNLQERLKQGEYEINKYQESLTLVQSQNSEIDQLKQNYKIQEIELDQQNKENRKLVESLKSGEQAILTCQEQIEKSNNIVNDLNKEIETLKQEVISQKAALDQQIKENQNQLESIKQLQQERSQYQQEFEVSSNSMKNQKIEINQLKQNAVIYESKLDSLNKENIMLQESLKQCEQKVIDSQVQIATLQIQLTNNYIQIDQLKQSAKMQATQLEQQIEQNRKIEQSIKQGDSQFLQYQEQIESLSQIIEEKGTQLLNFEKQLKSLMTDSENMKSNLLKQLEEAEQTKNIQNQQLQDQIQTITSQYNQMVLVKESLEGQMSENNEQIRSLKNTITEQLSSIDHLKNEIDQLLNQIQSKDAFINKLENTQTLQRQKLEQDLTQVESKSDESNRIIASLQDQDKQHQVNIVALQDQISALLTSIENVKIVNQNLIQDHNNSINTLQFDNLKQVKQLEDLNQERLTKVQSLLQQIDIINQELVQVLGKNKQLNDDLANKEILINEQNNQLQVQKSIIEDSKTQILALQNQIIQQQEKIDALQTNQHMISSSERQLIEQQEKYSQLLLQNTELNSKYLEQQKKNNENLFKYDQLKLETLQQESNWKKQIEDHASQIAHQSQLLSEQQIVIDQLQKQINQEQERSLDLRGKIDQLELAIQASQKSLQDNEQIAHSRIQELTLNLRQLEGNKKINIASTISENSVNDSDLFAQLSDLKQQLLDQMSISEKLSNDLSNKDKQIQTILDQYSNVSDNLQAEISYLNGLLVKQDTGKLKIDTLNEQLLSQTSDSILIQGQFMKQVLEQIQKSHQIQKFSLLYKGSKDKFTAQSFWYQIKGQGPFLFIMKLQTNQLIGVYTSIALSNDGTSSADESMTTFLFSITKQQIYQQRSSLKAVSTWMPGSNNLLAFGSGPDLLIDKEFNVQSTLNETYSTFGYQAANPKTHLLNSLKTKIMELLIFLL